MAKTDWQALSGGITDDNVRSGATAGVATPNGGGTHCYGTRLISGVAGVSGLYCLQQDFSPIEEKGGSISGVLKRASVTSATGFAPFLFFGAQSADVNGSGYVLGLADEAASHIQLRKGSLNTGVPSVSTIDPTAEPNTLMRSTNTFAPDTWIHLRLDVIFQGTGDVILQVFRNDLTLYTVTAPTWQTIPGMEGPFSSVTGFVDDALGVSTGTPPYEGGFCGFATRFEAPQRVSYFDHIQLSRQLG